NAEESFYVAMTARLIEQFPSGGGSFRIEPDASSGSYFVGADLLIRSQGGTEADEERAIRVEGWPSSGLQIDERFPEVMKSLVPLVRGLAMVPEPSKLSMGVTGGATSNGTSEVSRARDLGDSIMTAVVLAPFSTSPIRFTDLGRLRVQECERVQALRIELTRC